MSKCCEELPVKSTNLKTFTTGNTLWISVDGKNASTDLSNLIGNVSSENTYYIPVTSNGQTTFLNAFPVDEIFISLVIGIEHQLDVDYNIINQNIIWISNTQLEIDDILIVKTQKITE